VAQNWTLRHASRRSAHTGVRRRHTAPPLGYLRQSAGRLRSHKRTSSHPRPDAERFGNPIMHTEQDASYAGSRRSFPLDASCVELLDLAPAPAPRRGAPPFPGGAVPRPPRPVRALSGPPGALGPSLTGRDGGRIGTRTLNPISPVQLVRVRRSHLSVRGTNLRPVWP